MIIEISIISIMIIIAVKINKSTNKIKKMKNRLSVDKKGPKMYNIIKTIFNKEK